MGRMCGIGRTVALALIAIVASGPVRADSIQCKEFSSQTLASPFEFLDLLFQTGRKTLQLYCDGTQVGIVEVRQTDCMLHPDTEASQSREEVDAVEIRTYVKTGSDGTLFFDTYLSGDYSGWGYVADVPENSTLTAIRVARYCGRNHDVEENYSAQFTADLQTYDLIKILVELNMRK